MCHIEINLIYANRVDKDQLAHPHIGWQHIDLKESIRDCMDAEADLSQCLSHMSLDYFLLVEIHMFIIGVAKHHVITVFCKTSLGHEQECMCLYRHKPNHLRECVCFLFFLFFFSN